MFKRYYHPNSFKQLDRLYMCGNFGDPIIASDTLEVFQYLREQNSVMWFKHEYKCWCKERRLVDRTSKDIRQ